MKTYREFQTTVQRRLTTKLQHDRIGSLLLDQLLGKVGCHRLEVRLVGHVGARLHRGNVRIEEDNLDVLLFEGLDGLRTL